VSGCSARYEESILQKNEILRNFCIFRRRHVFSYSSDEYIFITIKKQCYEKYTVFGSRNPYYWMVIGILRLQCQWPDPYFISSRCSIYSSEFYQKRGSLANVRCEK